MPEVCAAVERRAILLECTRVAGNRFALPAGLLAAAQHLQEQLLHASVRGHLRMEGGHEQMSLAYENREAVALRENLDAWSHARDAWRADEDHLQRAARQRRGQ